MKIAINRCFGGFNLSTKALEYYNNLTGKDAKYHWDIERDDFALIQTLESIGLEESGGDHSELAIVEVPDDVKWQIEEYDGVEHVAEVHRTWN